MHCSMATRQIVGARCADCQCSHRSTSARARASIGRSEGGGGVVARYVRIALDSQSTKSSSTSTGTRPFGLSARKAGSCASLRRMFTRMSSSRRPSSYATARTSRQCGELGKSYSFTKGETTAAWKNHRDLQRPGISWHPLLVATDEQFLRELEPHRRAIVAHCYRMLGSLADAEEVAQESL